MNHNHENGNLFLVALQKQSLPEKCADLKKFIDKSKASALHQHYVQIVHQIFGINTTGWNITHLSPRQRLMDFTAVKEFLGINGALMQMIQKLQQDIAMFRFEFPLFMLPPIYNGGNADVQFLLQREVRSYNTLLGHLQLSNGSGPHQGQMCVMVSAFEFYFYHFARHITTNHPLPSYQQSYMNVSQLSTSSEDNCYFVLLDMYLSFFLPVDGSCPPATPLVKSQSDPVVRSATRMPTMLKKSPSKTTNSLGVSQNEIWRSDVLVRIFVEFWLGQVVSEPSKTQIIPSEDLVGAIRYLVKHVHFFCNATNSTLLNTTLNDSVVEQFKQNISYHCLQPHLFDFLVYCFDIWPLNASFRIVLETWLSYVQPWRYTDYKSTMTTAEMRLSSSRDIANSWYHFISINLPFYTKLFSDMLNRFLRMDLSNQANALLLFRVAKIYSQPNLLPMIEEAEMAYCDVNRSLNPVQGSYITSPRMLSRTQVSPDEVFTEENQFMIKQLLVVCQQAVGTLQKHCDAQQKDFSSWVLHVIGLDSLSDIGSTSDHNSKKCMQLLQDSMSMLSQLFEIPMPDINASNSSSLESSENNPLGPDAADCFIDENGAVQLTDLGKYQMINNIKKLPVYPKCDPELQPIRSYENATLVRLLYRISSSATAKYKVQIEGLCQETGVIGKTARYYFLPSASGTSPFGKSPNTTPRISLRFIAHYRNLIYLFLYFFVFKIMGYTFPISLVYLLFFCVSISLSKAFIMKPRKLV